jgi:peptidoglycan/LPS O-acetylase OafA/YrhL
MKRIPELDGLRGIAAIAVVAHHYLNAWIASPEPDSVASTAKVLTRWGFAGVDLFFVLSGFLIGGICLQQSKTTHFLKVFFLKRVCRIIPAYCTLLLVYFGLLVLIPVDRFAWLLSPSFSTVWFLTPLQNVGMTINNSYHSGMLSITWSLSVEEQFYLLAPFVFRYFRQGVIPWICITLTIISLGARIWLFDVPMAGLLTFTRLEGISLGILCAALIQNESVLRLLQRELRLLSLVLVGWSFVFCLLIIRGPGFLGISEPTVLACAFSSLIVFTYAGSGSLPLAPLRFSWLRYLARISFGVYLFHQLFSGLVFGLCKGASPSMQDEQDIVLAGVAFLLTIVFSEIHYRLIELPFLRRGASLQYN